MAIHLVLVGGTGIKCAKAFIHLCSAGFLADKNIHFYFFDLDKNNVNLLEVINNINQYKKIKKNISKKGYYSIQTQIFSANIKNITIINQIEDNEKLTFKEILEVENNSFENDLFELLFSKEQRESSFQNGFLGWSSVGASIVEKKLSSFSNLVQSIVADNDAKVFLVGSIFGGTGSSGIPTISRLLKNSINNDNNQNSNIKIGVLLMLPYFEFPKSEKEVDPSSRAENFHLKSKMALEYYYNQEFYNNCDSFYTIGENFLSQTSDINSLGGPNQENKAHFLELYGALVAINFFKGNTNKGYYEVTRGKSNEINWNDLIFNEDNYSSINILGRFISFSWLFNSYFHIILNYIYLNIDNPLYKKKLPTWSPYIFNTKNDLNIEFFKDIKEYIDEFHSWLNEIQDTKGNVKLNLYKSDYLSKSITSDTTMGDFIVGKSLSKKVGFWSKKDKLFTIQDFENKFSQDLVKGNTKSKGDIKFITELYHSALDY